MQYSPPAAPAQTAVPPVLLRPGLVTPPPASPSVWFFAPLFDAQSPKPPRTPRKGPPAFRERARRRRRRHRSECAEEGGGSWSPAPAAEARKHGCGMRSGRGPGRTAAAALRPAPRRGGRARPGAAWGGTVRHEGGAGVASVVPVDFLPPSEREPSLGPKFTLCPYHGVRPGRNMILQPTLHSPSSFASLSFWQSPPIRAAHCRQPSGEEVRRGSSAVIQLLVHVALPPVVLPPVRLLPPGTNLKAASLVRRAQSKRCGPAGRGRWSWTALWCHSAATPRC